MHDFQIKLTIMWPQGQSSSGILYTHDDVKNDHYGDVIASLSYNCKTATFIIQYSTPSNLT